LPRPLNTIHSVESDEEQAREALGYGSADALALARSTGAILFADDLGLRGLLQASGVSRSFSTPSLILALTAAGRLSAQEKNEAFARLLYRRSRFLPATAELILHVVNHEHEYGRECSLRALNQVTAPWLELQDAVILTVDVIKSVATATLQVASIAQILVAALEALARRWPRAIVAHNVKRTAVARMALLPQELRIVERICERFARGGQSVG